MPQSFPVRLTVVDATGDWSLLVFGEVKDHKGDVVREGGKVILQPGSRHMLHLAPGWYVLVFEVERHSGQFRIVAEQKNAPGEDWVSLNAVPGEWSVPPYTGQRAAFEVRGGE